ncbi:inositol monophosphatase family protein [Actinosynnema sp. NPDC091369]
MKRPLDQLADIAYNAIQIAAQKITQSRPGTVIEKSDRDTYTDIDLDIEREIKSYLSQVTPELGFAGEEQGLSENFREGDPFWALDPIDGTSNFVHGVPLSAAQLALIDESGSAVVAVIALPYQGMYYQATKGEGSHVNGSRIHVSRTPLLRQAIVSMGDYAVGKHSEERNRKRIKITAGLANNVERIRMFGSAAHDLAWLAEGRIDGVVILSNNLMDMAAGTLIAAEAGALLLDTKGDSYHPRSSDLVAGTPKILEELLAITRGAD